MPYLKKWQCENIRFNSVSEFWHLGININEFEAVDETKIIQNDSEKIEIIGHLSPLAPAIPGSPLDCLGMDPRSYLNLKPNGTGYQVDGVDIFWNDQVLLPPKKLGGKQSGFYYAGLYDRFGDADIHLPVRISDSTSGIKQFKLMHSSNIVGSLAKVRGRLKKMNHSQLDKKLFKLFPGLENISERIENGKKLIKTKKPSSKFSNRKLFVLEATEITLYENQPTSFHGTLWMSRAAGRKYKKEQVHGMYVEMANKKFFAIANEELKRIHYNRPNSGLIAYSPEPFGAKIPDIMISFLDDLENLRG